MTVCYLADWSLVLFFVCLFVCFFRILVSFTFFLLFLKLISENCCSSPRYSILLVHMYEHVWCVFRFSLPPPLSLYLPLSLSLSTDEKMKALNILPLQKQLYFNKAVLMFKVNRRMTPSYITSLFTESNNLTNRYVLPKPRIDLFKTSLSFSGSSCWNSLPVAIKTAGTIKRFKMELHQYLMRE